MEDADPITYQCPNCYVHFSADGHHGGASDGPKRLTLDQWTVYPADSSIQELPLPQQVEGDICWWLQFMAIQLEMMNNPSKIYGKIVFDPLGDIADFDVRSLEPAMLTQGFNNWMNTLSSGEILLDIVNGLILHISDDSGKQYQYKRLNQPHTQLQTLLKPLPVKRMLHTAPNDKAMFAFLVNFDCLLRDFMEPILAALHPVENPIEPGPMKDARQALRLLRHIGYSLLRNSYSSREWSWKALMVIVMILMAITGSLSGNLEKIFYCLTGEIELEGLAVPELRDAYRSVKVKEIAETKYSSSFTLQNYFPYKRVLKQGIIKFKNQLLSDFNLE